MLSFDLIRFHRCNLGVLFRSAAIVMAASTLGSAAFAEQPTTASLPQAQRLGFWSPTEQELGYRSMERIFATNVIKAGARPRPMPVAPKALQVEFIHENRPYTVDDYMKVGRPSGLLVVRDGTILLERYALGRKPEDRWTSFSIAKSVTSILVGVALRDGAIKSVDDRLSRYVPELRGGAYDKVTLRNALMMTSGVRWNEDYNDPASDFSQHATEMGPAFYKYMSSLPRDAEPGVTYHYSTAESSLIGAVVMKATGKSLSSYLSEKIWVPYGMERDGVWMTSKDGLETGGICFSATLRDYGRIGMFMLDGARIDGRPVVADGWVEASTRKQIATHFEGVDYGYQWWVEAAKGRYRGIGIMGQALVIDPARRLVIVLQSAWTNAGTKEQYELEGALLDGIAQAVDRAYPKGTAPSANRLGM